MAEVFDYKNITQGDPTTTVVKVGQGILHSIAFNTPVATAKIVIYDGTQGTEAIEGVIIGTIVVPASPQPNTLYYDIAFQTGLILVSSTVDQDITVSYR